MSSEMPESSETRAPALSRLRTELRSLGELRDGVLILGAGLYGAGYAIWSGARALQGLGALPGFDLQYFVAGVPPLALFVAAVWYLRAIPTLASRLAARWSWASHFSFRPAAMLSLSLLSVFVLHTLETSEPAEPVIWLFDLLGLGVSLALPIIMALPVTSEIPWWLRFGRQPPVLFRTLGSWGLILLCGLMVAVLYVFALLPRIPQSLGGSRPQSARLDIEAAKFSGDTLYLLRGASMEAVSGAVVLTSPLDVLFTGHDVLIVRPRIFGPPVEDSKDHILELRRDSVLAIEWSD